MTNNSSKIAALNGKHVEELILGHCSNPFNIVDCPEANIEIKSCVEFILTPGNKKSKRRRGNFKINIKQLQNLIDNNGWYLFVVQNKHLGDIKYEKLIFAKDLEEKFQFLKKKPTKHFYFSLLWTKIIKES
jgi:hypothetical protein